MTREKFIAELGRSLGRIGAQERREILADYEEHFRAGAAEGRTEEQVAQALGSPRALGRSYAIDALLQEPAGGTHPRAGSVVRAVFASISLGFFNIVVVLGPFLGVVGVMVGLWAGAVSIALSGVAVMLSPLALLVAPGIVSVAGFTAPFLVLAGIGIAGLGALATIGMLQLSHLFVRGTAAYVKLNARIVTRRS